MSAPSTSGSLDRFALARLAELDAARLRRRTIDTERTRGAHMVRDGRPVVSFSCNDYLGLAQDPAVIAAAVEATARWGAGVGASRLITGNHPLHGDLEGRLARLKGTGDALVFGSGYLANLGILPALVGRGDLIVVDELAHACILGGSRLSGATECRFAHNDVADAARLLALHRGSHRHALIVTDGVFSMDGDIAPLPDLARLARAHDAWLMTDDAHGLGTIGGGRGSAHAFGEPVAVDLQMGTLSKAVGAYGGYLCASAAVIDLLRSRARTFVYSTGLPPGTLAAAIAGLDRIAGDPVLTARPVMLARRFTTALGLPEAQTPIVPIILGEAQAALDASARLLEAGMLVTAIRPPTVPDGTARLRITFSAAHAEGEVDVLARAVAGLVPARA